MSGDESRAVVVSHWKRKAHEALASALREHAAGDLDLAVNRIYYACFYAACAALLSEGRSFVKHAGVRSAIHQYFVKTGRISAEFGELYDRAFDDRMEADYQVTNRPEPAAVLQQLRQAEQFVAEMGRIAGK
jgi:uncharacterized protein (UPF0332 family)